MAKAQALHSAVVGLSQGTVPVPVPVMLGIQRAGSVLAVVAEHLYTMLAVRALMAARPLLALLFSSGDEMATYVIVTESTGMVESLAVWDGISDWVPPDGCLAIESDVAQIGWTYSNGEFCAPPLPPEVPPTPEEILAGNTAVRDSLLAQATLAIAPLQDAVDLDDATAAETALLKKWKQYRVAVNRIDLTLAAPTWPEQP